MMKMGDWVRFSTTLYPNKEAVIFGDVRLTYKEFNGRINKLAQALLKAGVKKGERIAILATDCHQYLEINFAAAKIGAIFVPLNFRWREDDVEYGINYAQAVVLFVGDDYQAMISSMRAKLPTIKLFIAVTGSAAGMDKYDDLLSTGPDVEPAVDINERDVVNIQYTSGTTGFPKGAMLTHRNATVRSMNCMAEMRMEPHWIEYSGSPIFHVAGFYVHHPIIMRGGTVVLAKQFDVEGFARLVQKEKINYAFLVPAMINFLANWEGIEKYDLSSIKDIFYGGSPISVEGLKKAQNMFHGCNFWQAFGQTEDSPQTMLRPEDHVTEGDEQQKRRMYSVGKPVLGHWLKIVDENDNEVPAGDVGEIVCISDQRMKGYWENPEITAQTLRGGWLHTGDMGRMEADGYLYLVDRKNDMIIRGGENIFPAEIEQVLYTHPKIFEVAVIGVPDKTMGEDVMAVVVLREGAKATEEEIIEFCKGRIGGYKRPRKVTFMKDLPRNPSGKVLKRELKKEFWKGHERMI